VCTHLKTFFKHKVLTTHNTLWWITSSSWYNL